MKCNWKKLASETIASLSPDEREASIVYLDRRIIPAGEVLPWPGIARGFNEPVVVVFLDLQPSLNWTHRARYIILDNEGRIQQTINVDRPPYLTGTPPDLRMIHRGIKAPEWAEMAPPLED